ncbi:mutanase [Chaetomium sp. MPI-CAGE-AT-0009]|nr:mutanase [Chaetomium sp. MPI-CAGE-AT-0009]
MKLASILAALVAPCHVAARAVFAHFMVGNTASFEVSDWISNMNLAKDAHIDAFALNIAYAWPQNNQALDMAFQAATSTGFRLFFSFDYAGNGPWPANEVMDLIRKYGSHSAYFQHLNKPFVSTFEGPAQAADWITIKQTTPCFFMPDWSSLGAGPASTAAGGVADGLFSWAAWPYGANNMTTYVDASYLQALGSKPYMMPVSPWFYTNLPGYNKNWAWRGDHLWYDRWQQVLYLQPEFVQIISWNDFGESHYIGPLDDRQYEAFDIGHAPFNYVEDMPHDGWRIHLPWLIDTYKDLNPAVGTESAAMWFRKSPGASCRDGGTTGNTATQLQLEYPPKDIFQDKIFIAALLSEPASLMLGDKGGTYGSVEEWDYVPPGGVGIYRHSIDMADVMKFYSRGNFTLYISRGEDQWFIVAWTPLIVKETCYMGFTNWNPIVTAAYASPSHPVKSEKAMRLSDQQCVEGFGATYFGNFDDLCRLTCKYGYCPPSACVCTKMGEPGHIPETSSGAVGYPANGDMNYDGLCKFACNRLWTCPKECTLSPQPVYIPDNSPFSNPACRAGVAKPEFEDYYGGLCSYACNWGFCPMAVCTCTDLGYLNIPPPITGPGAESKGPDDAGLCNFACSRGYCPQPCIYAVPVNFDSSCSGEQRIMIRTEMSNAYDMAVAARDHLQDGDYYRDFFSQSLRDQPNFASDTVETYRRIADMLSGVSTEYAFTVTCDPSKPACWDKDWIASMNDVTQIMNFCPSFFDHPDIKYSTRVLNDCATINLRDAQFTKAAVIVHEATHTFYAMRDGPPAIDIAYGFTGCSALPLGQFDRSCVSYGQQKLDKKGVLSPALCPDEAGKEGLCPPEMSARNADTYSHVAAGIYFSKQCNRDIPYPSGPGSSREFSAVARGIDPASSSITAGTTAGAGEANRRSRRSTTTGDAPKCALMDDFIVFDGPDENARGILGHAHFGDSYASGMGTGITETNSCRVGSNNYGDLIYRYLDDNSLSYERLSCSGDTTDGLYGQIERWSNAPQVTVATLTIGGNDLDFSNLVYYCVITPNNFQWFSGYNRYWCVDYEKKARDHMNDLSDKGLRARLKDAYLRILSKTGRRDTNLYVAGYPLFFNEETSICNDSTFHYFWSGYKPSAGDWRRVWLTKELRKELNDLVRQLNFVIQDAINDANNAHGGKQVHWVDMVPAFRDGRHMWCEEGVYDPDSSRNETWFFLSAWPDVDSSTSAAEAAERETLFAQGQIVLPNADTCNTTLGLNADPYAVAMCHRAQEIRYDPGGLTALWFGRANADLASGNVSSQDVSWWLATRQIKTFHPRTNGMYAYRDAVLDAIRSNGQM